MLTQDFDDALLMASRIHADQKRKGTKIPYLSHLLGVAAIALEHGATEEQAIAALLLAGDEGIARLATELAPLRTLPVGDV